MGSEGGEEKKTKKVESARSQPAKKAEEKPVAPAEVVQPLAETQEEKELKERVQKEFSERLEKNKGVLVDFIGSYKIDNTKTWEEKNAEFINLIGLSGLTADEQELYIIGLQTFLFEPIGKISQVDGKMGPLSLATLYMRLEKKIPQFALDDEALRLKLGDPNQSATLRPFSQKTYSSFSRPSNKQHDVEKRERLNQEELLEVYLDVLKKKFGYEDYDSSILKPELSNFFYQKVAKFAVENQWQIDLHTEAGWNEVFAQLGLSKANIEEMNLGFEEELEDNEEVLIGHNDVPRREGLASTDEIVKHIGKGFSKEMEGFLKEDDSILEETKKWLVDDRVPQEEGDMGNYVNSIRKAENNYRNAYNKWKEASKDHSGYEKEENEKKVAFNALKNVWINYQYEFRQVDVDIFREYQRQAKKLANKYDISPSILLNPPRDMKDEPLLSGTMNEFLINPKSRPTSPINSEEDFFLYLNGNTEHEKRGTWKKMLERMNSKGHDPIMAINDWIYNNNLVRLTAEHEALVIAMKAKRKLGRKAVNNMSFEELGVPPTSQITTSEIAGSNRVKKIDTENSSAESKDEKIDLKLGKPAELIKNTVQNFITASEGKINYYNSLNTKLLDAFQEVKNDPYDWWNTISLFKGPKKALEDYQKAYDARRARGNSDFLTEQRVKDLAYERLKLAIEKFHEKHIAAFDRANKKYEVELLEIARDYDFHEKMPLELFNTRGLYSTSNLVHNDYNYIVKESGAKYVPKFFSSAYIEPYFMDKEAPTRAIKSQADLQKDLEGSNSEEKAFLAKEMFEAIENQGEKPLNVINSWIYYNNAARFAERNSTIIARITKERDEELSEIERMTLDELLA